MEKIMVYRYRYWDGDAGWVLSNQYATKEAIASGLGKALHDTAMLVERSSLRDGAVHVPNQGAEEAAGS